VPDLSPFPDAATISLIVSAVAVLVSLWFGILASRTAKQQNVLQERIVTLETARERDRLREAQSADVRASIEHRGTSEGLLIHNQGRATARKIRLLLDGVPALQHSMIFQGEDELTTLGPGATFRYELIAGFGTPNVLTVRIEWESDSGEPGRWESQLKV
jgi:hypothetical protein